MSFVIPDLDGWAAYCDNCKEARQVLHSRNRDAKKGEVYHEYTCAACYSIILTINRIDPAERREQVNPRDASEFAQIKEQL